MFRSTSTSISIIFTKCNPDGEHIKPNFVITPFSLWAVESVMKKAFFIWLGFILDYFIVRIEKSYPSGRIVFFSRGKENLSHENWNGNKFLPIPSPPHTTYTLIRLKLSVPYSSLFFFLLQFFFPLIKLCALYVF